MTLNLYLDHAATSAIRPEAEALILEALRLGGNPASVHATGRKALSLMETARGQVARLVGASVTDVVFTSGGTEANALAIESAALHPDITTLIVSAIEHDCVLETARAAAVAHGKALQICPVTHEGVLDLAALDALLERGSGRPFVALMLANNETGVIQPVAEVAARLAPRKGWLHCDAVQAAGKIPLDWSSLGCDTLSLSAHKLGGPQGVGALIYGAGATLVRRLHGGGQERGRRSGTENLSGIAGFGAAAEAAQAELSSGSYDSGARDLAQAALEAAGAIIVGKGAPRLPHILNVVTPGWSAQLQVMAMDLCGIRVSAGSACSSGKVKSSRVLEAMGYGEDAACGLRLSAGWSTQDSDWAAAASAWLACHQQYQARRPQFMAQGA